MNIYLKKLSNNQKKKLEKERLEQQRLEQQRLEQQRMEQQRLEKIAILVCGQIRNSNLGYKHNNTIFSNDLKNNLLSKEITDNYDINIFFCVDEINKESLSKCCGNYLKDVIQLNYENIEEPLDLEKIEKNYFNYFENRINNRDKYPLYKSINQRSSYVHKFYKLYCAYKLMLKYENNNKIKYDYIMYLRPDCTITVNFYPYIKQFIEQQLEYTAALECIYFGKYNIMCHLCELVLCYGKYNIGEIIHEQNYYIQMKHYRQADHYYKWNDIATCWGESPEVQVVEHILNYCYKNNISSNFLSNIIDDGVFQLIFDRKI